MVSPYRNTIRKQILDGKRTWSNAECGGDHDIFLTEVVKPLRDLKYDGLFDALSEIEAAIDGEVYVIGVEIIGAINYHQDENE